MVNLEWFRTFKAIYETESLTAAANELFISQHGVSLHLNSLEAHVGSKLFDRGTRKMLPTEHGKILYNSIVDAINKLEIAEKHFYRNNDSDKMNVSIGMCFETFQFVLEPYISQLPFNLISKFGDYPAMLSDLDKGLLDFVITPQKDGSLNISYTRFSKERIILVAGANSDISEFTELLQTCSDKKLEDWLNNQLWFGTTRDMEHLRNFWIQNFKKRPTFKPNYIVPNLSSIIRCITGKNGKIERYHRSIKSAVNLQHYYTPEQLNEAIIEYVEFYNKERYHESINNLTPEDMYLGRGERILQERQKIKLKSLKNRRLTYERNKLCTQPSQVRVL